MLWFRSIKLFLAEVIVDATVVQVETEFKKLAIISKGRVTNMTRKFERELGKGGFGVVYNGCLKDSTEVAVKMLYLMCYDQFFYKLDNISEQNNSHLLLP